MFVANYCLAEKYNGYVVEFLNGLQHSRLVVDGKPVAFYNGYTLKGNDVTLEAVVGGITFRAVMKRGMTYKAELYADSELLAEGRIMS